MSRLRIMWKHFFYYSLIFFVIFCLFAFFISREIRYNLLDQGKDVDNLISNINRGIFFWTITLIIFGLILNLILSKTLTKPVSKIVHITKKIVGRDLRISTIKVNELDEVTYLLNYMKEEIQRLSAELAREKNEFSKILSSMVEGVVVLGSAGKIVLTNNGFKTICGVPVEENIIDKYYWEILRNIDFKRLIDNVWSKGKIEGFELHIGDKIYLSNANLTPDKEKIIVVIHDITEIKRLEQIKSEFVANASHELRTPLTAIKGFVETLQEEEKGEEKRKFLEIIKKHTDRMINLISDLLLLSKLEQKGQKLEIEDIDLRELISNVITIFKNKAENKGLKIEFVISDRIQTIKGDPFLMEQVFINLIDNAIKYTQKGGIKIELFDLDKQTKIEVSDTGIGIPKEHLPRIFERFYTIDKARSRELGGTGLGLSVVKHIVLAHNGKIDVETAPGKGSKFIIILPKEQPPQF